MIKSILGFILLSISPAIFAEQSFPSSGNLSPSNQATAVAENPDVEHQVMGDYPALNREETLPLGAIQHAWDNAAPGAGVFQVHYNPREIIKIKAREFMITTIVFPHWEIIEEIELGDPSNYRITKSKSNVILIQPVNYVGLDSNITMIGGSGNVYSFYIRTEGYNSKNVADLKVNILVPAPHFAIHGTKKPTLSERIDYLDAVAFDPSKLDFDFSMSCDPSIAPERVFSDGTRTWFDYGKDIGSKNLPTIYAVIDGIDTPINVSRDGTRLVAQATGIFTLKSGEKTTCVYPSKKRS